MKKIIFLSLISLLFLHCTKIDNSQKEKDDLLIKGYFDKKKDYFELHKIKPIKTESGLYYSIDPETNKNTGKQPSENATVRISYTGKLLNDSIFDTSIGSEISLSSTIQGWKEGIVKFKVGNKGQLFIPSHLGYGKTEKSRIPASSVLVFEVEVLEIIR